MSTLDEVKNYLRIDFEDDDRLLESLINVADEYLKGAISSQYNSQSERAKMLTLIMIGDLYDSRGLTQKVGGTIRNLVSDFSLQLKLESGVSNGAL